MKDMRELIPWGKKGEEVFHPLTAFQKRMNDLFEDFFKNFEELPLTPWRALGTRMDFTPRVNVTENDKELKVTAELPGLSEKEIEVSLDNNVLTIKGEKKEEHEEKDSHHHCVERRYGSFYRSIPIPAEIEQEKIEAACKDGLLTISLPKKAVVGSQAKKIPIKSS